MAADEKTILFLSVFTASEIEKIFFHAWFFTNFQIYDSSVTECKLVSF